MQQMGGEIAYAHALGAEAKQWIANNPSAFALNSVKHVFQFYFPPTWQWDIYRQVSRGTWLKATVTWTIALLGIAGALAALLWWRGAWIYVVVLTFVPVLPYAFVQPILRYRYIVLLPLLFLAVEFVSRLLRRVRAVNSEPADGMVGCRTGGVL
jgi:hypothetical protein